MSSPALNAPFRASHIVHLEAGQALRLGSAGGELTVVDGCAWLTIDHDVDDYFLAAGDRVRIRAFRRSVVESAITDSRVRLAWEPRGSALVTAMLAIPRQGMAFVRVRL